MNILILHGIFGAAGKYWMQWLNDELTKAGHTVIMPNLPNSEDPDRSIWLRTIQELVKDIPNEELIIVGHSLGVPAALDYIETLDTPIRSLISIAGFYEDYGLELNTKYMSSKEIDIEKARKNIQKPVVIFSNNDPYVPQDTLKKLAEGLKVEPVIIENGGHFNADTEYKENFPLLLQLITLI